MTTLVLFQQGGIIGVFYNLIPFIGVIAVFYFLILQPQKKRQRELQTMIENLKAGDRIITSGGVIATITAVRDASLLIRTADKSMLEVTRASVIGMQGEEEKK